MFRNRSDAGKKLGFELKDKKIKADLVLAIPFGGIPVAVEVAKILKLDLNFVIVRKLPLLEDPEAGFGAISEDGSLVLLKKRYDKKTINEIIKEQKQEIKKRIKLLRKKKLNLRGKKVILVDDGLAMGSTMECAIKTCKNLKAKKIIVAVPTGSLLTVKRLEKLVDKVVCLDVREFFVAVADAYEEWHDVSEKEALELLKKKDL